MKPAFKSSPEQTVHSGAGQEGSCFVCQKDGVGGLSSNSSTYLLLLSPFSLEFGNSSTHTS